MHANDGDGRNGGRGYPAVRGAALPPWAGARRIPKCAGAAANGKGAYEINLQIFNGSLCNTLKIVLTAYAHL